MLEFQPLNEDNVVAVALLEKECFGKNAWSENLLRGEIDQSDKYYTVVLLDGKVVAYGGFAKVIDEGDIMNIAVSSEYRRQGFAGMVLSDFFNKSKELGIKSFTLEVRVSNEPARKLYEKYGFEFSGIRTKYYSDGEDCCIYWKYM